MIHQNAVRYCRVVPATAVVAVLVTMKLMLLFVVANLAEGGDSTETSSTDEPTTTQNLIKILYCTS